MRDCKVNLFSETKTHLLYKKSMLQWGNCIMSIFHVVKAFLDNFNISIRNTAILLANRTLEWEIYQYLRSGIYCISHTIRYSRWQEKVLLYQLCFLNGHKLFMLKEFEILSFIWEWSEIFSTIRKRPKKMMSCLWYFFYIY